jgi:Protein of unknwon function (DUF3310)
MRKRDAVKVKSKIVLGPKLVKDVHMALFGRDAVVHHPPHYTSHPSGVECIVIVEHFGFSIGNAIKYLWRAGLKGGAVEDLKKARWYIDREIQRLEKRLENRRA